MAPPVNQSNWIYGISEEAMANYTADNANPDELIKFVTAEQQAAEITVTTANNEGESTGTDWGTEQWKESHDVNIPFSINSTMRMTSRLLNGAFGQKLTTNPALGVTRDVYTPQDAAISRQLPVYWLAEKCADRHDALYPSGMLEKATFKGDEKGKINVAGNFRGSGRQIMDADVPIVPETDKYYLKNTGSKIVRATAAAPAVPVKQYGGGATCGLQSWMFDVDQQADPNIGYDPTCQRFYTPGDEDSGIIRSYHLFGRRKYSGQWLIWLENSAPELAILRAQDALNLKMGMYGKTITGAHKNFIEFEMFLAYYRAVELGNKNGYVTMQITPDAFFSESDNKIVAATIQYATPA